MLWTTRDAALMAPTPADTVRMPIARRIRQFLEGDWRAQLAEHGHRQLGPLRARLVGEWDTSANLLGALTSQIAVRYDELPLLQGPGAESMGDLLEGYWGGIAQLHEQYVLGLRVSAIYVGWDDHTQMPALELVTPDVLSIDGAEANKRRPAIIRWARRRPVPDKPTEVSWFWDVYDLSDPANPSYTVWTNDLRRDVSAAYINPAEWRGSAYPIRDEARRPVAPFGLTYANATKSGVWPLSTRQSELVFGTLQVGLLWTAMVHGFLRASWDQRVVVNGRIAGGTKKVVEGRQVRSITPDPTSILEIQQKGDAAAAFGAWGASIDIRAAEEVARRYEQRLAIHVGLSPADVVIESLNPASGASLTVQQAGKRRLQKRSTPAARLGDQSLYRAISAVARGRGGLTGIDSRGLSTTYAGVSLTPEERVTVNSYCVVERSHGVLDRLGHLMEVHPTLTEKDADDALQRMDMRAERDQVTALLRANRTASAPAEEPEADADDEVEETE